VRPARLRGAEAPVPSARRPGVVPMDGPGRGEARLDLPPVRAHLVDIGGEGMTGLAQWLRRRGVAVSGSAAAAVPELDGLRRLGIRVRAGHAPAHLPRDAGVLVYGPDVPRDDPQRLKAARAGLPQVAAPRVLEGLMRRGIGVAMVGARGAGPAAAMVAWTLTQAGRDPTAILGASAPQLGGFARRGRGPHCVVEAFEVAGVLEPPGPLVAGILGPPAVLPGRRRATVACLRQFAASVPAQGSLVGRARDARVRRALRGLAAPVEWFSMRRGRDWWGTDLREERGRYRFRAFARGRFVLEARLQVPGRRGVLAALAAIAVCARLDLPAREIKEGLEEFSGMARGLECRGSFRGVTLVDDRAQDPGGVAESLACCRRAYGRRRLRAVLRTDWVPEATGGWEAFVPALAEARDVLLVAAAEPLVGALRGGGIRAQPVADLRAAVGVLDRRLEPGDVLVTLGAGDVGKVADEFLRRLPRDHHGR
jgi:UDP-N-acetylmuramate--alanine ligase